MFIIFATAWFWSFEGPVRWPSQRRSQYPYCSPLLLESELPMFSNPTNFRLDMVVAHPGRWVTKEKFTEAMDFYMQYIYSLRIHVWRPTVAMDLGCQTCGWEILSVTDLRHDGMPSAIAAKSWPKSHTLWDDMVRGPSEATPIDVVHPVDRGSKSKNRWIMTIFLALQTI